MNFSDMNQKQLCDAIIEMHKYDNDVDAIISVNEMLEELKWLLSSVVFSEFKKSLIERFPLFYKSNNS